MRIPNKITVDYKTFAIRQIKGKTFQASTGKKKLVGEIDTNKQWIRIAKEQHPDEKANTFLHEILHAVCDAEGVPSHEKYVTKIANRLYQVIKDNNLHF